MSNNNKQLLDLTEPLLVFDKAQAPSTTRAQSAEASSTTTEISLDIPEINQPDVTTRNLSHSDKLTIGSLLDCAKRGENRGKQPSPSICKVSRILRDLSKSSYKPQLVSIGPIHREDPKLKEFEWRKECYLNDLLIRCDSPKKTLDACRRKVNTSISEIRESYADVKNYSDVELAMMMVMDGCFILEFCFKHRNKENSLPNKMQNTGIAMDLMLLENQVPFFVLQDLFNCSMGKMSFTLSQVLDAYLAPYIKLFRSQICHGSDVVSDSTPAHVLGYLHKRYQLPSHRRLNTPSKAKHAEASKPVDEEQAAKSSNPTDSEKDEEGMEDTAFHSIVELDRSGMNFKPHQEDEWSMKIKFQSSHFACLPGVWKPTLLMPTLVIDDTTELILRNFIAYEQSFPTDRYYFTSYAHVMDMHIDTQEDIAKLVESKVLVNNLGSNQEAADMINKLCKNIIIDDFYYNQEFKQVDKYYNRFWPKNIAKARRIYFSNPWSAIALVAAIILFSITVVQFVYTIIGA